MDFVFGHLYESTQHENFCIKIQRTVVNTIPLTNTRYIAPFVQCPKEVANAALIFAKIASDDILVDLGCGNGVILWSALEFKPKKVVGVELDPFLNETLAVSKKLNEGKGSEILLMNVDMFTVEIIELGATLLILYLLPAGLEKLKTRLLNFLQASRKNRIVTINYEIPGMNFKEIVHVKNYRLYKYFCE